MDKREFDRMKKDAEKTAGEYKARSVPPSDTEPPANKEVHEKEQNKPEQTEAPVTEGLLSALLKDKDKTIILSLILLLMGEDGNYDLLLALLYLLI